MTRLFLTGYENEDLDEFLNKIEKLKIKSLIDVREIALSRKNGFSKNALKDHLAKRKITYHHLPELGSPTELREGLRSTGDYLTFFTEYRDYINKEPSLVEDLIKIIIENKRSVLFCYEKDYELCHRSIIVDQMIKKNPQIIVTPV